MARTILFDFAQGGGATFTNGRVTLAPTSSRTLGSTIVLPGTVPAQLVDGKASIPDVDPTPTDPQGWRYQVRIESTDRRVHEYLVEVPTGTTPINFSTLPVVAMMTLPLGATGVELQQWLASVRSRAAAADQNALTAMQGVIDTNARIDGIIIGPGSALPTAGIAGQVLTKTSNDDFAVEWKTPASGPVTFIPRHESISDPGPGTPLRTINMDYPPDPNEAPDFERITIQGAITTWRNEWGALRGTPSSALKDDALVRGVARDDLGPTSTGGFIELVQRSWPLGDTRRQPFQVRWRDGAILRNGAEMALCYVRYGASPIPSHLPPGTVVVTVND